MIFTPEQLIMLCFAAWAFVMTWWAFRKDTEIMDFKNDVSDKFANQTLVVANHARGWTETWNETWGRTQEKILAMNGNVNSYAQSVEQVQEHLAKIRDSMMQMQEQISNKRPVLGIPKGAIQVEIYTPTKKLGKGRKQSATGTA